MSAAPGKKRTRLLLGTWVLLAAAARAEVALPEAFSDGMVLQRGETVPVWGTAAEGEKVTVEFRGRTAEGVAKDGRWRVEVPPGEPGGPFAMTVRGTNTVTLEDVLVGDVWLVSGQSNSTHPFFRDSPPPPEESAGRVRLFWTDRRQANSNRWIEGGKISMFAWYFGHGLAREEKVPVGLLVAAMGGLRLEELMPPAARERKVRRRAFEDFLDPVRPFRIRGAVFWQGESDLVEAGAYGARFTRLIAAWREAWGQGDFPFLWVQLENLTPKAPWVGKHVEKGLPVLWDAQRRVLSAPNTGMVPALDVSSAIHPGQKEKQVISERMVAAARAVAYGRQDVEWSGPLLEGAELRGGEVVLRFSHAGKGLAARDGALRGFEVQAAGGAFAAAEARLRGREVELPAEGLARPLRVRYAWRHSPDANLVNGAGLPASPFLSDPIE